MNNENLDSLEFVLDDLFKAANLLQQILYPYRNELLNIYPKPLEEMGLSEKVKVGQFILKVRKTS